MEAQQISTNKLVNYKLVNYNDLENQVRHNPETGEILEIYDQPTGPTDAVAMQHDVDYSVCGDNQKCKKG